MSIRTCDNTNRGEGVNFIKDADISGVYIDSFSREIKLENLKKYKYRFLIFLIGKDYFFL